MSDHERELFWAAAADGKLRLRRCGVCGDRRIRPSPSCPRCGSADHETIETDGGGTVLSYTVVHHRDAPSTTVVLVQTDGGGRSIGVWAGATDPTVDGRVSLLPDEGGVGPLVYASTPD